MNNFKSYTEYAVSTPTTDFVIGFDFNYGTDAVNVTVDDVPATEAGYSVIYLNSTTMRLSPAVPTGVVRLQRETDIDVPDNQFTAGAKFIASNMDENFTQLRHAQQEVRDYSADTQRTVTTALGNYESRIEDVEATTASNTTRLNNEVTARKQADTLETQARVQGDLDSRRYAEDLLAMGNIWDGISARSVWDNELGLNQQEINNSLTGVSEKVNREFVSVWDFFTKSEKQSYNFALLNGTSATYDSHRQLKEFFDYIAANDVGTAYCSGTFYTTKGILFGGALGSKTKQVMGDFHICAIAGSTIHTLFHMQCGKELTWLGSVHVQGLGGLIFSARTVRRGLVLGGEYQCAHTYINSVNADEGFSEFGVLIGNLTTASNIDAIRVTRCGSGRSNATNSWTDRTSFTVHSESASAGVTQETVLSVTKLPLPDLQYNPILKIGNELYHVKNVDYVNSRLTIFPILNRDNTETFARYIYGAGVATAGGDASVCRIGKINSTNCGVVYHSGALYPAIVGAITAESNTINVLLGGNTPSQAHVGGAINSLYCEAAEYDIVRRSRAQMSMTIVTNYALNLDKLYDLTRSRGVTSNILDTASVGFDGIQIAYNGNWLTWENRAQGNNNNTAIDVTDVNRSEYWHYGTNRTFNIATPNAAINNQFGYNRKSCVVVGSNNAGNPTGDIVFNAPAGYTVNGSSSVTFNGFTQAAKFDVYLQHSRNNFVVVCLTLPPTIVLSASVTYDPELLAPNEIKYWNVTLSGVQLGDAVVCSFNKALNGTRMWAEVTGANIVTVYHQNPTANPIDLPSGSLMVKKI